MFLKNANKKINKNDKIAVEEEEEERESETERDEKGRPKK